MVGSTPGHRPSPVATLGEGELLRLGEWVRDVSLTLGGGSLTDPLEAMLFHETLTDAIDTLSARQSMREAMQRHSGYEDRSAPALPISLEDSARQIIDRATASDFSGPPPEAEQAARIHFALSLDPRCSDAYVIQGCLDERAGRYQQAQAAYERAMELAAEKLGPDAFTEESRKAERIHFWYSHGTREYMRPRAALAYLLWQKMGRLKEAITHFQAMLDLNPGDNQGTRDALLCCLLEAGDDEALAVALERFHYYDRETIEPQDIAGTVWYYTHACWLFRTHPPTTLGEGSQRATAALRKAFRHNQYVPRFLLAPQGLPGLDELAPYALGDPTEAVMYVNLALKGWQQTRGALTWLETTARQARLLPTGQRRGKAQPITISVIASRRGWER